MKPPRFFARPLATVAPRDLLLLQHLQPQPRDVTLEIGTGSGSSLFRLADSVAALHSLDISTGTIERLRRFAAKSQGPLRNVQLFVADFCQPEAAAQLPARYDLIFSCDTLEHVADPGTFLANVYQALNPGGRAFLVYPNEHPSHAHGITFFERREMLTELLRKAGFAADQIEIQTFRMARGARRVLDLGWRWPRRLGKKILRLVRRTRRQTVPSPSPAPDSSATAVASDAPQTFDQTDFFSVANRLEPLAPVINAYCWGLMRLMTWTGPVYELSPAPEVSWDTQILMQARRGPDT
jgi:SAM-dependent methyltransferase